MHEDGIGLNSLGAKNGGSSGNGLSSRVEGGVGKGLGGRESDGKYHARVTTMSMVGRSNTGSEEEFSKIEGDGESEDGILPIQQQRNHTRKVGITKTVNISIS